MQRACPKMALPREVQADRIGVRDRCAPSHALVACLLLCGTTPALSQVRLIAAGDLDHASAWLWARVETAGTYRCEVSTNADFSPVAFAADVEAVEGGPLTIRVQAQGLEANTVYYYRFRALDAPAGAATAASAGSASGRFRTFPSPDALAPLRFAFSGDSNFAYSPLRLLDAVAREDAAFFLWFGDTIYADAPSGGLGAARTLAEYRAKYDQMHSDPHVRSLLASSPVLVGWDDHEVRNDYAGADPQLDTQQRNAAYQAFFEHMPITPPADPTDPYRTYRRVRFGANVEFFLLDGRQYREPSARTACNGHPDPTGYIAGALFNDPACAAQLSAPRTMLGDTQREWLISGLWASTARVKFVVTSVPLQFLGILPYDRWDGYDAERREILEAIASAGVEGVFLLTTDFHGNFYNPDVLSYFRRFRPDYRLPPSAPVPELIVGPIGMETFSETLDEIRAAITSSATLGGVSDLLAALESHLYGQLRQVSGVTLVEPNRLAYALIDVDASGGVHFELKGISPESTDPAPQADTIFSAAQSGPSPVAAGASCCALPLVLGGVAVLSTWLVRRRVHNA